MSPAGPVDDSVLLKGVDVLERWGYQVEVGAHALDRDRYFAGTDEERSADLIEALLSNEVRGIFSSRGGYGSMRLLPEIPWDRIKALPPKTFVGFSDIGALQIALLQRSGLGSFSGPQVAHGLGGGVSEKSVRHLRTMIDGSQKSLAWDEQDIVLIPTKSSRSAHGILIPVCLSILVALIGTPYQLDSGGCIVCIEDVEEPPYRLDRMFWQLRATRAIDEVAAFVLGKFTWRGEDISEEALAIATDIFADVDLPIWAGLPYGHVNDHITIPMGALSEIDVNGQFNLVDFQRT